MFAGRAGPPDDGVLDVAPHHERQLRCVVCQGPIPPGREQFAVLVDSSVIDSRDPDKDGRRLVIACSGEHLAAGHEQQRRSGAMNNCGRAAGPGRQRTAPGTPMSLAAPRPPRRAQRRRSPARPRTGGRATTPRVSPMPTRRAFRLPAAETTTLTRPGRSLLVRGSGRWSGRVSPRTTRRCAPGPPGRAAPAPPGEKPRASCLAIVSVPTRRGQQAATGLLADDGP